MHFSDIWNGFWDISKKLFLKKIVRCYSFLKRLDLGLITFFSVFFFFFYCWESSLPWTAQSWQCFRKIRGGGVFSRYFEPLYLKNYWRYQNEHGSIRSSLAPFFFAPVSLWMLTLILRPKFRHRVVLIWQLASVLKDLFWKWIRSTGLTFYISQYTKKCGT